MALVIRYGEVEIFDIDEPDPRSPEVVIEASVVGVCGEALHRVEHEYALSLPVSPGHRSPFRTGS